MSQILNYYLTLRDNLKKNKEFGATKGVPVFQTHV